MALSRCDCYEDVAEVDSILLHPRFAVVTERPDGSDKVSSDRRISHCLASLLCSRFGQWITSHGLPLVSIKMEASTVSFPRAKN